jgi:hypothetical protein
VNRFWLGISALLLWASVAMAQTPTRRNALLPILPPPKEDFSP